MPTAERRKQPRPVSTEDDLARFHASVAGGNHFPTTTRRPRTRANTGSDLAHARETTREKRRTERPRGAQSAETKGVALARRICEVPPRLAYRADVKKPETSSGFWNWWWGGTLRQTYVTQRLRTAANSCGKVRNPAPTANNPTSSARPGSPAKCIRQDASSIPICGIEPASASTHPTFDQAVTNLSRKARRPWS